MTAEAVSPPKRKIRWGQIAIWSGVALVLILTGLGMARSFEAQPQYGPAPDFTLTTFDGQTIRLSDYKGQVVVINFWASWCGPCIEEAPALEQAYQDYRDEGVVFIGIAYVDSEEKSRAFIQKYGVTYLNGPDIGTHISMDLYRVKGVPETFIVGRSGQIVFFRALPLDYETLSAEIERALAE